MSESETPSSEDEAQILTEYLPKLIRLAASNMNAQLQQKLGPEDIGQTVLRTVIRRSQAGMLKISQSEDFWKLLVTITLCKVRKKHRFYGAQKRSAQVEQPMAVEPVDYRSLQKGPSNEEATEFADLLFKLQDRLPPRANEILLRKLEDKTHHQIATELGISTRQITRDLGIIADAIRLLGDDE